MDLVVGGSESGLKGVADMSVTGEQEGPRYPSPPDTDVHPSRPFRFCPYCAVAMELVTDSADECRRPVCPRCHFVHYEGPRLLVVCVLMHRRSALMLKRAIEPFAGKWAFPGGFVEEYESPQQAAARELFEEVGVSVDANLLVPAGITYVVHMNQVHLSYQLRVAERPEVSIGPEADAAAWFEAAEIRSDEFWVPTSTGDVTQFLECNDEYSYAFGISNATEEEHASRLYRLSATDTQ